MHRGGYSESDALNDGIEAEEIILDQLPDPEQESEEDMAIGDKLVNLDDLKVAYDKQQGDTNSLKSALAYNDDLTLHDKHVISSSEIVQGGWVVSTPNSNANRIRSAILYKVAKDDFVLINNPTHEVYIGLLASPTASSYTGHYGYIAPSNIERKYTFPADGYINIIIEKVGEGNISPSEYDSTITIQKANADFNDQKQITADRQNDVLKEVSFFEDFFHVLLGRGNFVKNVFNPNSGQVTEMNYRIMSRNQIVFPYDVILTAESGFRFYPYLYNSTTQQWMGSSWYTSYEVPANKPFYTQIARTQEDTSEIADVQLFLSSVKVTAPKNTIDMVNAAKIENGMWRYGEKTNNSTRLRAESLVQVNKNDPIVYDVGSLDVFFCYLASAEAASWTVTQRTGAGVYFAPADGYIAINISNAGETAITAFDFNGIILLPHGLSNAIANYSAVKKNNNLPTITNGKNVYVYHFGGEGNDWCFVRTPSNYNHVDKAQACPFVICNHGNGWVMDGTIQKANWTKRTMYVPLDDPDYIDDPTEYNGTSDESLWYSNPTIEALLQAGYVVCGCENYGDGLYGNNDCRNACVDFFYHMISSWNVKDWCYMIGASNGAMTSLNAAYLLQGQVKAMILQYPLTCLVNQYEHYPNHQAGIRAAYGISDPDITIAELTKAVATHDPLTVDVVDGKKVGVFPPTKLYYSPDDVVVNCNYNALALYTMLDNSNKVVAKVECSGEHGDHTHFAPADYVAWFNAN